MKRRPTLIWIVCVAVDIFLSIDIRGATFEAFEGPETSWRVAEADAGPRVISHERRFSEAHSGRGCEFIQFSAGQGTAIYLAHTIARSRIIPELVPSVWFKADRSGPQFMARVVFPRSLGKDGQPLTSFLLGDSYRDAGAWRQLRIENLPQKLQRKAQNLRTQSNTSVDEREAYIDRLVLNVYTGQGETSVWIDDLELSVFASASAEPAAAISNVPAFSPSEAAHPNASKDATPEPGRTGLQGTVLVANGRPMFVRAIEHQGETFAYLQSLGFNAVLLTTPATEAQLEEAKRSEVWLIAPPPLTQGAIEIRPDHERVLGWFLGEFLTADHEDRINRIVQDLQQQDPQRQRPILFHVSRGYSHFRHDRGVLLFERSVIGTSFELREFGNWLAQAALHGRVDAPFWTAIPTELPAELRTQLNRLGAEASNVPAIEPDQIRLLVYEAVARGTRGLYFRSRSRLDRQESVSKQRAAMLHALNRELELLAPWAAAGTVLGEKTTNHPHVRVFALQTTSSRLLLVSRLPSEQQYVSSAFDSEPISFVVHGTPLSDQAYAVTPQGVASIAAQRGGGVRIALDGAQPVSLVLLTQDPLAVNYVGRVTADIRREYAARQIEIVENLLAETNHIHQQLASNAPGDPRQSTRLAQAQADWRQATSLFDGGDARNAILSCSRSLFGLKRIRRDYWESAVLNFPSPGSSPLCATFSTLPLHHTLSNHLAQVTWSVNVLAAGEMEHLEHLLQTGWRQHRTAIPQVNMDVQLSLDGPRVGRSSLHLRAWSEDQAPSRLDGEWPIMITSPAIAVREGQLVRIHGWAKVPRPLESSTDGLLIFDSQGGPALAERVTETQGWREFTLYRVVNSSNEFNLVFAFTGLGEAWIDDVSVTVSEVNPAP